MTTIEKVEQIRRAWKSARPKDSNPAWKNAHHDIGVLLGFIDAHLTRAPVRVTDEEMDRCERLLTACTCIDDYKSRDMVDPECDACNLGSEVIDTFKRMRAALEFARLAQPVVAKVPDAVAKLIDSQKNPSAEDRALITDNLEFLISQRQPQAAQTLVLDALNEAGRRYPDAANAIAWLSGALAAQGSEGGK